MRSFVKPTVVALALTAGACADMPAAQISSMSEDKITVVYYDSIAGMGNAASMAKDHCGAKGTTLVSAGEKNDGMIDQRWATFDCRHSEG